MMMMYLVSIFFLIWLIMLSNFPLVYFLCHGMILNAFYFSLAPTSQKRGKNLPQSVLVTEVLGFIWILKIT
jgi:hypothetical protein